MKSTIQKFVLSLIFIVFSMLGSANNKQFTLVIDPGHGGHDAGAIGKISKEKDINLKVALQVGKMIEAQHPDVKVIYTRKTDIFIPLENRAKIANNNKADFFISIHTNAAKSTSARGTETFILGLAKSQANLEVAMRENAVITLEDDYKEKYNNFDPKSIDSYIMFEFMQDRNLDKSLQLASHIENQFSKANRSSRGVRQAGFLVLHKTAAPSVLIELGFISNVTEEKYLNSKAGLNELSNAIYNAFVTYKKEHDKKSTSHLSASVPSKTSTTNTAPPAETTAVVNENSDIVYKIQLFALKTKLKPNDARYKGLKGVDSYIESGFYKYTYGTEHNYDSIVKLRQSIINLFPESFVIALKGSEKINLNEARKQNK